MSQNTASNDSTAAPQIDSPGVVSRTRFAIRTALGRRDSFGVFLATTLGYTVAYLLGVRHLELSGSGFTFRVAQDPLSRLFQQANSAVNFEPIALLETEFFTYLFSLNTPIGLAIGALVGLNLAITYLAWRQPAACGLGSSSAGLIAGIPALLSGSACCGPIILIVLGVQATGIFAPAVFAFLLPVAVLLLIGSLLLIGRQIDPDLVAKLD